LREQAPKIVPMAMNIYAINQKGVLFISLNTLLRENMISIIFLAWLIIVIFFI